MAKNYLKCISFIFLIEQLLQSNFPVWKSKYDSWNTFFSLTFIYSSINLCTVARNILISLFFFFTYPLETQDVRCQMQEPGE